MLHFFRKYQRAFFLVITIVIVISFSFFGTYSTLENPVQTEKVVATSIDGSDISRNELEEMALFLGSDSADKLLYNGQWGPNFLNDGVFREDFLTTGLAEVIISNFGADLISDLQSRLMREKLYTSYRNPNSKLISASNAWGYFAPDIKDKLLQLQEQADAISPEGISSRVNLYLAERRFPSSILRQVLKYQEQQYPWIPADQNLDSTDLSLFGYHTVEDWFGPRFTRLLAQVIINSAKVAEQRGYVVTQDEALASLIRNAQKSYEQNKGSPYLKVANSQEYLREQLRLMGMDQQRAVNLWRHVLLFRRLFHDLGNSVVVDTLPYKQFGGYTQEFVSGDLYQLPPELRFADYRALQKLEVYLDAVSKTPKEERDLSLPKEFLTLAEVSKSHPELVQKRYLIEIASVNKNSLQTKVGLKETWQWELDEANWEKLKKVHADLGLKNPKTRDERFAILEGLDDKTRSRLDTYARLAIVEQHPEWLEQALTDTPMKKQVFGLRKKGNLPPFVGLKDNELLKKALDRAYDSKQPELFTFDNQNYYRVLVLGRDNQEEILTFAEASKEGVLDQLLDRTLKDHYKLLREKQPEKYQNPDKSFKEYKDITSVIADDYFANVLKAIKETYQKANAGKNLTNTPKELTGDLSASYRLYPHMLSTLERIKKNPTKANQWVKEKNEKEAVSENSLPKTTPLADQWKLEKKDYSLSKHFNEESLIIKSTAFGLKPDQWSTINTPPSGDLTFFQLKEKGVDLDEKTIAEHVTQGQKSLSYEAQRLLMQKLLQDFKEKEAISLEYLKRNNDE